MAGANRRSLMLGCLVGRPRRQEIVPGYSEPCSGPDREIDVRENGFATVSWLIQVDHEGPGALAQGFRREPSKLVRFEEIRVRLELIANFISLTLGWLGKGQIDSNALAYSQIKVGNNRIAVDQVAGAAGAKGLI